MPTQVPTPAPGKGGKGGKGGKDGSSAFEPPANFACAAGYVAHLKARYVGGPQFAVPIGETGANLLECWRAASEATPEAAGVLWDFAVGGCEALVSWEALAPWTSTFADDQDKVKLCLHNPFAPEPVPAS